MRKASNKISDIITELLEYIKFYINRIISTEINISIKKNILRISTDKMSRNDILSLVIRFDNQLKLFKSIPKFFIFEAVLGITSIEKLLIFFSLTLFFNN